MDEQFHLLMYQNRNLKIELNNNLPYKIFGEIPVQSKNSIYGIFDCTIVLDKNYPYVFPAVFENSGKIPKNADRHVNRDGSLCLCAPQKAILLAKQGIKISEFYNELLIPYLASQIYYEKKKIWPGGEYSHGIEGEIEFFFDYFNLKRREDLFKVLKCFLENTKSKKKTLCFCGSMLNLKKCCWNKLTHLSEYPDGYVIRILRYLDQKHNV